MRLLIWPLPKEAVAVLDERLPFSAPVSSWRRSMTAFDKAPNKRRLSKSFQQNKLPEQLATQIPHRIFFYQTVNSESPYRWSAYCPTRLSSPHAYINGMGETLKLAISVAR